MTESALILHFDVLLPKHLGAVMFLSYCSQNSWEQSYLCLTAPNCCGSSQTNRWNSVLTAPKYFWLLPIIMTSPNLSVFARGHLPPFFFPRDKNRAFHWLLPIFVATCTIFWLLPTHLGAVVLQSMTESALKITFYILLPTGLGAVGQKLGAVILKLGAVRKKLGAVRQKWEQSDKSWEQPFCPQWQRVH